MLQYVGIELNNRFKLERSIDSGNFGAVYEARDNKFDSPVAVKILFEHALTSEQAFRREAKLARQFRHPNVVEVFDFGVDEEKQIAYIVMEFLKGPRVDQLIFESDFDKRLFCRFVDHVGSALFSAHNKQLVHRDLKPQNVMLVNRNRPDERFVLLDLGVSTKTDSASTLRNQTLDGAMSPQYASPEQVKGETVDFRSDVYSFGTIMYEWVTRHPPFPGDQLWSLISAICTEEPTPPSQLAPERDVPQAVEDIILKCLSKKPEDRPESLNVVREAVLGAMMTSMEIPLLSISPSDTGYPPVGDQQDIPTEPIQGNTSGGTLMPPGGDYARTLPAGAKDEFAATVIPSSAQTDIPAGQVQPQGKSPMVPVLATAVIMGLLATVGYLMFVKPGPGPVEPIKQGGGDGPPPVISTGGDNSPVPPKTIRFDSIADVDLTADGEAQVTLVLRPAVSPVTYAVVEKPEWLSVELPEMPIAQGLVTLKLKAGLVDDSDEATVRVTAATAGKSVAAGEFKVRLSRPDTWVPAGFRVAARSKLVRSPVDGTVLYDAIEKPISETHAVRFQVVLPTKNSEVKNPFYMMQDKAWNGLLTEFSNATNILPDDPDRLSWRQGGIAAGEVLGIDDPRLPIMNLTAFEAHELAIWLGGESAHLPTTAQWDLAAGFSKWKDGELEGTPYATGPYRAESQRPAVAVDLRKFGPRPVGSSLDDVSPLEFRDMAGNGVEITCDLQSGGRLPDCDDFAFVLTRGRNYFSSRPLSWNDIVDATGSSIAPVIDAGKRNPCTGFRVVIEIDR